MQAAGDQGSLPVPRSLMMGTNHCQAVRDAKPVPALRKALFAPPSKLHLCIPPAMKFANLLCVIHIHPGMLLLILPNQIFINQKDKNLVRNRINSSAGQS